MGNTRRQEDAATRNLIEAMQRETALLRAQLKLARLDIERLARTLCQSSVDVSQYSRSLRRPRNPDIPPGLPL